MLGSILDVGQCPPDHAAITRFLHSLAEISVTSTPLPSTAMQLLKERPFDLVLVNRKIDEDYSDGMELIHRMKADPQTASIPVMLVSNYADAQAEAIGAGALPGFGKADLNTDEARRRVRSALGVAESKTLA